MHSLCGTSAGLCCWATSSRCLIERRKGDPNDWDRMLIHLFLPTLANIVQSLKEF